jgi:hypothetical protein
MRNWEDMSDRGITIYALVVAVLVSGGVLAQPILYFLRHGFSWSPWLLGHVLFAAALGAFAFFVNRQGGRHMRRHRRRSSRR